MLLLPVGVDVDMQRWPWMNWVIMTVTFFAYFYCWRQGEPTFFFELCVAGGDHWIGHLLHPLAHLDMVHLVGNLVFLWVFGNAICSKVGNIAYPLIYFGLGFLGSLANSLIDDQPGVGASGAINGIVGMFLIWYALNTVQILWFWFLRTGIFEVAAFWAILMWLAFDILGVLHGGGSVGHWAHITGLAVGAALAVLLIVSKLVEMDEDERSLIDLLRGTEASPKKKSVQPASVSARAGVQPRTGTGGRGSSGPMRAIRPGSNGGGQPDGQPSPQPGSARPARTAKPAEDDPIPLADAPEVPKEKRPTR